MSNTTAFPRLGYLDGLRGVTCLAVVLHHCVFHGARVHFDNPVLGSIASLMNLGYSGVETFFILSGFCIAGPMFVDNHKFRLGDYLFARFRRLYPAYILSFMALVCAGFVVARLSSSPFQYEFPRPSLSDIFAGITLYRVWGNTVFWTLVIEARWYVLLPLFVLGIGAIDRRYRSTWIGSAVALSISIMLSVCYVKGINIHVSVIRKLCYMIGLVLAYLPLLVIGVVFARHRLHIQNSEKMAKPVIGVMLVCIFVLAATQFPADPTTFTIAKRIVFAGISASALFGLTLVSRPFQRILEIPVFRHLGKVSYSTYLVHLPLIHVFKHWVPSTSLSQTVAFLVYLILLPMGLLIISSFAYHAIESPFLRRKVGARV